MRLMRHHSLTTLKTEDLFTEVPVSDDADETMSEEERDSDWKIFPLTITAADDVCVKLNELIQTCKIPKDKIMYKYLKDTVHIMINYDHKYDPDVVEFFNTIEYLGGGSTVNFLRGPMFHGQGRGGIRNAEDAACNLGGPSKRTRDKKRGGYTTKSGVLKDLHLAFITLADENASNVPPFIETESVKVIGVAMENDGTPLKPGIQFDDRMKTNVGLKQEVDIKFVRDNPNLRIFAWQHYYRSKRILHYIPLQQLKYAYSSILSY